MEPRSRPFSAARRRASGEERVRCVEPAGAEGAAGAAGAEGAVGAGGAAGAVGAGAAGAGACAFSAGGDEGAAVGASAINDAMSSSGAAITPIREPTGEVPPSSRRRFRNTPSPRATSSMMALSVSTSARTSPLLTASFSAFNHFTRRPSSIVGESASIKTFVAIGSRPGLVVYVHDFLHRRDRLRHVRLGRPLEVLRVRHGHVRLVHAHYRRVEIVEAVALDVVDDL